MCPESVTHLAGPSPSPQAHLAAVLPFGGIGHRDGAWCPRPGDRMGELSVSFA